MALIGNIKPFNVKQSDITAYMERIDQLFLSNEVEAARKVPLFLTLIGGEAYSVLKDLLAPTLPSEKTFDQLKTALVERYSPKRLTFAERYKFYSAKQEGNEDVKSFATRLQRLAKYCEFAAFLDEAFACGLSSETIKRKLLTEDNLTYSKACQTVIGVELADGQVKVLRNETVSINKLKFQRSSQVRDNTSQNHVDAKSHSQQSSQQSSHSQQFNSHHSKYSQQSNHRRCKRCLRVHYDGNRCPAVNWKCYSCNRMGHTAKSSLCKNFVQNLENNDQSEVNGDSTVEEEQEFLELGLLQEVAKSESQGELYNVQSVAAKENESLKVKVQIENKTVLLEVDSGACRLVIHVIDYYKFLSHCKLEPVKFKLKVVTGENVVIIGQVLVQVIYKGQKFKLYLTVLNSKTKFDPLLSRNWLSKFNPNWKNFINAHIIAEYQKISDSNESLGCKGKSSRSSVKVSAKSSQISKISAKHRPESWKLK